MNRLFVLIGCIVLWSGAVVAQEPDLIFEQGFENDPDAVEILSLTANPASVFEGQSTTISWTIKDAASCDATDGTPEWRALVLDGSDGSFAVTTLATEGVYSFTLTCTGSVGDPPTDTKTIDITVSVAPPVQILSFVATPDTINVGETTTLSWTLLDAVSCTPSGGTAQWAALSLTGSNGSVVITDLDTAGEIQFALNCDGFAGDSDAAVAGVMVEALSCSAPTLDTGINKTWSGFWGEAFPDSVGTDVAQVLPTGLYLSIQFNTGAVVNNGLFVSNKYVLTSGTRLGTISKCIGRFEAPAECTHTWVAGDSDNTGINWATDGKVGACVLQPNTNYFMNVTFTDGVDSNTDSCTTPDCSVLLRHELDPVDP